MTIPQKNSRRPNVVIIIMDDLCYGDLACHGNPYTRTPNLDNFYKQSSHFTRCCSGPLCSPARASIMTGRYHMRTRVVDTYCGRSMIDPEEITLAQVFSQAGYRTGLFGKWHLGDNSPNRPQDMGFETVLMHKGGGIGQPGDHPENLNRESYFDPFLYENGKAKQFKGYCTDIFTDAALDFIRQNKDEPFFAYLATNAPHVPLQISDEWADTYRKMNLPEEHARLYGMVENIDWNVGRLLKTLEELSLTEDTIVLYTSDHGPCPGAKARELPENKQDRFNCGLRGIKGTVYEGGIRVPSLWRWPGSFPASQDIDEPVHQLDVLPTLCTACGLDKPHARLDGVDLMPLLTGEKKNQMKRAIFMQWHRGDVPVKNRNCAVVTKQYKLVRCAESGRDELYDLLADPGELNDIAELHPEIVSEYHQRYEEWYADVSSTRPDNYAPPPIDLGSDRQKTAELTRQDWRIHGLDGWSESHYGHWETKVCESGKYRIKAKFAIKLACDSTAYFSAGDKTCAQNMPAGFDNIVFDNIELSAGNVKIEIWSEAVHAKIPALFVDIEPEYKE